MMTLHPLKQPLERQLRVLERQLQDALDGEVEPLHRVRVATRRLRELLPLCDPVVRGGLVSRARRRVRRVGRSLGRVREIDVALELVAELADGGRLRAAAAGRLRGYLGDERRARRRRMLARVTSAPTRKVTRDLAEVAKAVGNDGGTDAWALVLAGRLGYRSRRLSDAVISAGAFYASERVHAVRIAAKKLRYGLEIAGEIRGLESHAAASQLKVIQDTLGRLHDFEILRSLIQELPLSRDRLRRGGGQLDALRRTLAGDCRTLHAEFVTAQPELIEVCEVARRVALRIWTDYGDGRAGGRVAKMSLAGLPGQAVILGDRPL